MNINNNPGNSNFKSGFNSNNKPYIIIDNNDVNNLNKKSNNGIDIDYEEKIGNKSIKESPGFISKKIMKLNMQEKENNLSNNFGNSINKNFNNNENIKFSFGNFTNAYNPSRNTYTKIHRNSINSSSNRISNNESKIGNCKNINNKGNYI